jgi:hypothetical protein
VPFYNRRRCTKLCELSFTLLINSIDHGLRNLEKRRKKTFFTWKLLCTRVLMLFTAVHPELGDECCDEQLAVTSLSGLSSVPTVNFGTIS